MSTSKGCTRLRSELFEIKETKVKTVKSEGSLLPVSIGPYVGEVSGPRSSSLQSSDLDRYPSPVPGSPRREFLRSL